MNVRWRVKLDVPASRLHNITANRWFGIRMELLGNMIVSRARSEQLFSEARAETQPVSSQIFFTALFATLSKEWNWGVSAGVVGVSVSYALTVSFPRRQQFQL